MNNKEKEIEELAKFMRFTACGKYKECENEKCVMCFCPSKEDAEILYNAGYRKTFTSDLASVAQKAYKEGYEQGTADAREEFKFITQRNKELLKERDEVQKNYVAVLKHNAYLRNCIREEKKEAVKEFAEKLKAKAWQGYDVGMYIVNTQDIDELLKEYEK